MTRSSNGNNGWVTLYKCMRVVYIFSVIVNLEPVHRSKEGCDMRKRRSFNRSTCKTLMDLLKAIYLRLKKIVVKRVTAVKFSIDSRGSDGTGCFRIKVTMNTSDFTNMRITGLSSSKIKLRLCARRMVLSEELSPILDSFLLRPIMINLVLEE